MNLARHRALAATLGSLCAVVLAGSLAATASAAAPKPFGHACQAQDGVRFCPTTDLAQRVPTWDGVPLDVDVTLPAQGNGPFPTIVMLHGWGGSKTDFESSTPQGNGSTTYDYNNNYYAKLGYAVLNYTARGFGNSCGGGTSGDHSGACGQGYIRLADTRYEARDTQYLLGKLVDEGITQPNAIGVTGISYGGGQSMELAFLEQQDPQAQRHARALEEPQWHAAPHRRRLAPLAVVGPGRRAASQRPLPGHRTSPREAQSLNPVGTPDPELPRGPLRARQVERLLLRHRAGLHSVHEPRRQPADELRRDPGRTAAERRREGRAAGAPMSSTTPTRCGSSTGHSRPAPLLIENGWTDDLFPPEHALRAYNYLRQAYSRVPGEPPVRRPRPQPRGEQGAHQQVPEQPGLPVLRRPPGELAKGPAPGSVTAFSQTCPEHDTRRRAVQGADVGGAAAPGRDLRLRRARRRSRLPAGTPQVASAFDPIAGTSDSCKTIAQTNEPNTATYQHKFSSPLNMIGLPTVHANIDTTGNFGQIDARLWDISGGQQRLISRGVYSLKNNQSGRIAFQLHGNGWRFAEGRRRRAAAAREGRPLLPGRATNRSRSRSSKLRVSLPKLAGGVRRLSVATLSRRRWAAPSSRATP